MRTHQEVTRNLPKRRSLPKSDLRGIAAPIGAGPAAGERKSPAKGRSLAIECFRVIANPKGASPPALGTRSPTKEDGAS